MQLIFCSNKNQLRRILSVLLVLVVVCAKAQDTEDEKTGPLSTVKEKYDDLPQAAKIGVAAATGFVTSKVALRTFVTAAKVTGATFIA